MFLLSFLGFSIMTSLVLALVETVIISRVKFHLTQKLYLAESRGGRNTHGNSEGQGRIDARKGDIDSVPGVLD